MLKLIKRLKSKKSGFTLIELIVVIAILGILAAVLVPSILGYVSEAKKNADAANAHNLFSAAQLAYINLEQKGTAVAAKDYTTATDGSDPFVVEIKKNIPGIEEFTVHVGDNGVEYVYYGTGTDLRYPATTTATP